MKDTADEAKIEEDVDDDFTSTSFNSQASNRSELTDDNEADSSVTTDIEDFAIPSTNSVTFHNDHPWDPSFNALAYALAGQGTVGEGEFGDTVAGINTGGIAVFGAGDEREHRGPLVVAVGPRDARVLVDAGDAHRELEPDFADVGVADNRRGVAGNAVRHRAAP